MPTTFETLTVVRGARLRRKDDNKNMASAQDIVSSAYQLQGAPYRAYDGGSIPMWMDEYAYGGPVGDPPPLHWLQNGGVMGADLINYALRVNGLPAGGGTGTFANYLVGTVPFDPSTPGQVGAIALRPYQGPHDDGSIALYLDAHRLIQSIPNEGVTNAYTDVVTYNWAAQGYPRYGFTIYGFLPGVQYY